MNDSHTLRDRGGLGLPQQSAIRGLDRLLEPGFRWMSSPVSPR